MKRKLLALVMALAMVLSAIAGLAASLESSQYREIYLDVSSIVLNAGENYQVKVSSEPSGVRVSDLDWSSDDGRVVKVSSGGVITTTGVLGGAIVTARARSGASASVYVGVGAPYGYNYGYYSGYYPGDYYYPSYYYDDYYTPYYYDSAYYSPYYYSPQYYDYDYSDYYRYGRNRDRYYYDRDYYYSPYYNYSSYYNDYYTNGYYDRYYPYGYSVYVNRDNKVVYSVNKSNPTSYVRPGTSTSAAMMALEVQQGVTTKYDGHAVGFAYVNSANSLVVTPESTGVKENALTLTNNLLNRFSRFSFKSLKYRIPDVEVSVYPDFKLSGALELSVTKKDSSALTDTISGPWKISGNADKQELSYRFILEDKQTKSTIDLVKLGDDGAYKSVDRDLWKVMSSSVGDAYTYFVETEKMTPGTYALVKVTK